MIGQGAVDFDAAIDRTRVHDHRTLCGACESLGSEAVTRKELARGIPQIFRHSLALDPQHHDDIGPGNGVVDVARSGKVVG